MSTQAQVAYPTSQDLVFCPRQTLRALYCRWEKKTRQAGKEGRLKKRHVHITRPCVLPPVQDRPLGHYTVSGEGRRSRQTGKEGRLKKRHVHITRPCVLPKNTLQGIVSGKRRSRQTNKWTDNITGWTELGLRQKMAAANSHHP